MKVFEVKYEDYSKGKEITTITEYVIGPKLLTVTNHFTRHCEEYEYHLMSVREVLTVVQVIEDNEQEEK